MFALTAKDFVSLKLNSVIFMLIENIQNKYATKTSKMTAWDPNRIYVVALFTSKTGSSEPCNNKETKEIRNSR